MKHGAHAIQRNAHARPFPLANFPTAGHEQRLDITPGDSRANRGREDSLKGSLRPSNPSGQMRR
jgi:hypothetical protein